MAQISGQTTIYFQSFTPSIALGGYVSGVKIYNPTLVTMLTVVTEEAGNGVNMVQRTFQFWG